MVSKIALTAFFAFLYIIGFGQNYHLSGIVRLYNGESVPYAIVKNTYTSDVIVANEFGYFNFDVKNGNQALEVSHIGYGAKIFSLIIQSDTFITFYLSQSELPEIVVRDEKSAAYRQTLLGKVSLNILEIKKIPSLTAETDIIKNLSFLSGISGGQEGKADIYIRGGDIDQNLILLDGVPIYSMHHAGAYVSSFNSYAISGVDLYKDGFPARFSGKLSGIIDLKVREGNRDSIQRKMNIGMLSSGFIIDGPLKNNHTTFMVSGRFVYWSILNAKKIWLYHINRKKLMALGKSEIFIPNYTFGDFNAKIVHELNEKEKIYFNFFYGIDYLNLINENDNWNEYIYQKQFIGNTIATMGYQKIMAQNLFFNISSSYSSYRNFFSDSLMNFDNQTFQSQQSFTGIQDFSVQTVFDWYFNKHYFRVGLSGKAFSFVPNIYEIQYTVQQENKLDTIVGNNERYKTYDAVFFVENKFNTKSFSSDVGLNLLNYFTESGKHRMYFEPRVSLRYLIGDNLSVKLAYTKMHQNIFRIQKLDDLFSSEQNVLASDTYHGAISNQFSAGFFGEIKSTGIEYSLSAFYKKMNHLLYYGFYQIQQNRIPNWSDGIYKNGSGEAKGLELEMKKSWKKYSFALSYTYLNSVRQFEELNFGKSFIAPYERKHDINVHFVHHLSKEILYGFQFQFHTGLPATLPVAKSLGTAFFDGFYIYNGINNGRLPPYHRADFFINKNWMFEGNLYHLSFNVYNIYAKRNPEVVFFANNTLKGKVNIIILPSINLEIDFL